MYSLIEIDQVVLYKKRTFKILEYYFIKSVLPSFNEEHIPSFEQIEDELENWQSVRAQQRILELIGPNI